MIHVCNADHARQPKLIKRMRRWFIRLLGFAIPCAHCGKGFGRQAFEQTGLWSDTPVSLDWSCRIYHARCYDEMCWLPLSEQAARRAELRGMR